MGGNGNLDEEVKSAGPQDAGSVAAAGVAGLFGFVSNLTSSVVKNASSTVAQLSTLQ